MTGPSAGMVDRRRSERRAGNGVRVQISPRAVDVIIDYVILSKGAPKQRRSF